MKNAGNELDDEDLAAYMKQSGLGTPAARAAIIERLLPIWLCRTEQKEAVADCQGQSTDSRNPSQLLRILL